ncbi:baculoviral IAP repeat-containing protein 7 isoform X5 [Sciurus carolinensis]|uniref:baculoviral IAP repeat-containing protein 7 isoform X5 n=1 Tax=Sciurus carolinensis TaxID=30640 RepID=UPI001FB427F3|nr:baculoviral IAP repeat-containing protein 7 isoform X5 [Sciurus carolinensis]
MGPKGRAKCSCCGPEQGPWAASHDPRWEHHRLRCLCGCVLGQDHVDGQILGQLRPLTEEEEAGEAGATLPMGPVFPGMVSEELRLASFYDWPSTAGVQPEALAAAGFFHTGQQDKVRCFFCYGGLQSWERGDDPWTEHAKWFPRCQFLLQSKGRGFVRSVQEAYSPLFGSWDQWEEPEDAAPTAPSDARGGQEWSERSQYPDVSASMSSSQLVADLLQEEYGDQAARARAPVHGAPELLTYRGEVQPEGAEDLQEQLRRLQEERRCKVCLDRATSIVFVPCGHLVCAECAPSLQLCPICRAAIRSRVRTFLS